MFTNNEHGKISVFLNPESFRTKKRISVADICRHRISENVQMKYMLIYMAASEIQIK
jgi:hypothetical protein